LYDGGQFFFSQLNECTILKKKKLKRFTADYCCEKVKKGT